MGDKSKEIAKTLSFYIMKREQRIISFFGSSEFIVNQMTLGRYKDK